MVIERTIDAQATRGARTPGEVVAPKKPELTREQQEQIREAHTEVDVYLKYGLRESAVEALDKILSLNPADEKALEASIGLTLGIGRREDALRHTVSLGMLRLSRGQTDLATKGLEEGKRIRKDDPGLAILEARIKSIKDGGSPAAAVEEAAPKAVPSTGAAFDLNLGDGVLDRSEAPILVEEAGGEGPDLEEADFYFRQGLFSDALPIYREYHRGHPENVQVRERIEEIERKLGKAPVVPVVTPAAPVALPEEAPGEAEMVILEEEAEDEQTIEAMIAEAEEAVAGDEGVAEAEVEATEVAEETFAIEEEPEEEAVAVEMEAAPLLGETLPEIPRAAAAPAAPVAEPAAGIPSVERGGAGDDFFDLAAELDEEISQLEEAKGANLDEAPTEDLASVFREFQEGVQAAIDDQDVDTHYNLGIAYKEMGLFSEAVAEFGIAMKSVERSWDSAVMMGICYRERGDFDRAIEAFTKALLISDRSDDEYVGLRYELAQVYEKAGKHGEAVGLYREIQSRSKGFADVAERIDRLVMHEDPRSSTLLEGRDSEPTPVIRRSSQPEEPVIAAPSPAQAEPMKEDAAKPKKNRVSYL
jgi:tetratricopeptide (TPR) repeat protein